MIRFHIQNLKKKNNKNLFNTFVNSPITSVQIQGMYFIIFHLFIFKAESIFAQLSERLHGVYCLGQSVKSTLP